MLKKLTTGQIVGIGVALAVVLSLVMVFALIRPTQQKTAETTKSAETTENEGGTPEKVAGKRKEKEREEAKAKKAKEDWRVYSKDYMPDLNFDKKADLISVYQNKGLLDRAGYGIKDIPTVWGTWLEAWYRTQRERNVALENPYFPIDAYSADPNDISKLTNLTFPAAGKPWAVAVTVKDFNAAMAHLRSFNGMRRHGMPVVSDVAFEGHSPNLRLTYNLMLYVIPGTEPPLEDPRIAGGTGTTGGGGGMTMGGTGAAAMMSMMGGRRSTGGGAPAGGSAKGAE
jgi:hypothetical protein